MLNPELQKDIDAEIVKADQNQQDFLTGQYFRDTVDLIIRVNKLNEDQAESIELETILSILGLSDHDNITEAIRAECGIETESTVNQVVEDLKKFIFDKINPVQTVKVISDTPPSQKPLRSTILDAYGKEILAPPVLDYYENKRQEVSSIPMVKEKSPSAVIVTAPEVMHDSYREVPDAVDEGRQEI